MVRAGASKRATFAGRSPSAPTPTSPRPPPSRHLGLYADAFTPLSRGFDSTYGFLTGGEDHLTQAGDVGAKCGNGSTVYDIWAAGAVASQFQGNYTAYEINDRAVGVIEAHPADAPLFMYLALHNTHAPIQAEQKYLDLYPDVADSLQQRFWAMVSTVDDTVGNVTAALKARGMWDNTLLVWLTDNGSPIQVAGSNAPLRGVKGSNWEGGVRTPAVVSGGLLPPAQRGARSAGVAHIVDWYATFCGLAGVPAADPAGPEPEIDSLDLWPWLSGAAPASPRDAGLTVLDHSMYRNTTTGAIRFGRYKLLVGGSFSSGEAPAAGEWGASWFGAFSPNKTFPGTAFYACPPASPCLFDVVADPAEHNDLAASQPALLAAMLERFRALEATYHPPVEGPAAENAELCAAAEASRARNGGKLFVQPWRQP
jgi:arylsulfatase A-like enzyme